MKNLILIPFMALVGCANNDAVQITQPDGPDSLFSFREEEYNDDREMATVICPGNLTEYQIIGELPYGDVDYITTNLEGMDANALYVLLDVNENYGAYARIDIRTTFGEEQMLWTGLVEGTREVMVQLPENTESWTLGFVRPSLFVSTYIWRAEVEVY